MQNKNNLQQIGTRSTFNQPWAKNPEFPLNHIGNAFAST